MSEAVVDSHAESVLARLDLVMDELIALPLDSYADDDLLAIWRRVETAVRRSAAVDHALIGQVRTRRLDYHHGATSTAAFTRQVVRISVREAKARVRAAEAAGPRVALSGEPLPPVYERVAAAQADGDISPAHARIIVQTIDALPDQVRAEEGASAEKLLVEKAGIFDPDTLTIVARRLALTLDPDGKYQDPDYRDRRRDLRLTVRRDGSAHLEAELTAEATEHLRVAIDPLDKPMPATDGARDPRTAGQRRHDALLAAIKLVERAELLPTCIGVTATVILTFDAKDWIDDTGIATTGHGVLVPTAEAKRWISLDTEVIGVLLGTMKRVEAYSSVHRIFTKAQRLVLDVRDGGCTIPGCDAPPSKCEAHHVTDYANDGPTSVVNAALVCTTDHRERIRQGWRSTMINGIPHWIQPNWIDPEQKPQRNWMHDPAAGLDS
jgi:hypothetical protein